VETVGRSVDPRLHTVADANQWRSDGGAGGAGRTGRHLLGAANGRKTPKIKKKIRVKIQIVSFICVCVQEKQSCCALLSAN